jgi:hypothetical protein
MIRGQHFHGINSKAKISFDAAFIAAARSAAINAKDAATALDQIPRRLGNWP